MDDLLGLSLIDGPLVIGVYAATATAIVLLVVLHHRGGPRIAKRAQPAERAQPAHAVGARAAARRPSRVATSIVLVGGVLLGAGLTWLLVDVVDLFGVDLTPVARTWAAVGIGALLLTLYCAFHAIARGRAWRAVLGVVASLLVLTTTAMTINIDFGQYPTVRSALGISPFAVADGQLPSTADDPSRPTIADWKAPAGMPAKGTVLQQSIPATTSGFPARDAVIYLPPAALVEHAPLLPVLIVMSGQPGSPSDPMEGSRLQQTMDDYAGAHGGLAPIVVSPDQLGDPETNPMCVDSPLGNSASYLTVDVPAWIRANLAVLPDAADWGIGGLSQGGTCAIQLGAAHPELFGVILDASGELAPSLGAEADTISQGFGGDSARYEAAKPVSIMAANTPYSGMFAVFGVGANDESFAPGVRTVFAAAQQAGMDAHYIEVPDAAHDQMAWSTIFHDGVALINAHWGLGD